MNYSKSRHHLKTGQSWIPAAPPARMLFCKFNVIFFGEPQNSTVGLKNRTRKTERHPISESFEVQFLNGPNHSKTELFTIRNSNIQNGRSSLGHFI